MITISSSRIKKHIELECLFIFLFTLRVLSSSVETGGRPFQQNPKEAKVRYFPH